MSSPTKSVVVAQRLEVPTTEVGYAALVGQKVLIFTTTYIYYGLLETVNCDTLTLSNPHIVFETGEFSAKKFTNAQSLLAPTWTLTLGHIESAGITTQEPA